MEWDLAHFEDNTPPANEKKPRWRTPKLTSEQVAAVTEGDYVPFGNDNGPAGYAQGYETLS